MLNTASILEPACHLLRACALVLRCLDWSLSSPNTNCGQSNYLNYPVLRRQLGDSVGETYNGIQTLYIDGTASNVILLKRQSQ